MNKGGPESGPHLSLRREHACEHIGETSGRGCRWEVKTEVLVSFTSPDSVLRDVQSPCGFSLG